MEFKEMTIEQLETRLAEIPAELEKDDADLDALENEVRDIKQEMETRRAEEAQREEIRTQVAAGSGKVTEEIHTEEHNMDLKEIRSSKEYVNAYANYLKSNDDTEVRALLTENATGGTVPVPTIVEGIVKTAWEKENLMALVRKANLKGNLKIGFEISADGAVAHTEGGAAVTEEALTLGIVTLTPVSLKKWISLSDEAYDMGGEDFLNYIYSEITYRIAKKAADLLVAAIVAAPATSTATAPQVPVVQAASIAVGTVASALAQLSDEAANPAIVMNKQTWGAFRAAQYAANFPVDPFEGCTVVYNNSLPAFDDASAGDTYMIVGDFGHGAIANFPNGEGVEIKFDDKTLMTSDMIRVLGREYVAVGVVAPDAFVKVTA